jgi:hypothetical protein
MDALVETPFKAYFVIGANWRGKVEINPDDFLPNKDALIMEVLTRGVEKFFEGEVEITGDGEASIGLLLAVCEEDDFLNEDKYMFCAAPIVLANAGQYKAAKEVQKIIDKKVKKDNKL